MITFNFCTWIHVYPNYLYWCIISSIILHSRWNIEIILVFLEVRQSILSYSCQSTIFSYCHWSGIKYKTHFVIPIEFLSTSNFIFFIVNPNFTLYKLRTPRIWQDQQELYLERTKWSLINMSILHFFHSIKLYHYS
jgi:hypothetical protein